MRADETYKKKGKGKQIFGRKKNLGLKTFEKNWGPKKLLVQKFW